MCPEMRGFFVYLQEYIQQQIPLPCNILHTPEKLHSHYNVPSLITVKFLEFIKTQFKTYI